ncbi:MAG: ribosome maturation factor RimP [Gemmatimonadetes bacterium]|nr:ribosome maturation factor RimP [Gemmatimonadota bacterium]MBI2616112.1 ribosome maturation factor RimP [Gemmatimonadota bacterium]
MPDDLAGLISQVRSRVEGLGFDLADLRKGGRSRRIRLEVRIDRPASVPGQGVTVDDCAQVSRALEQWLDASLVLGSNYILEVSSPGIERPLRWRQHWERFVGRDVNLRLRGRGRRRATIVGVVADDDAVVLRLAGDEGEVTVPLSEVREATLAVDWE